MKESVGYTVTLNIMIVFIAIIVAFLCAALIYFKSNKVSNIITTAIEKYEGYNVTAINEINMNLTSIGYNKKQINCAATIEDKGAKSQKPADDRSPRLCNLVNPGNVFISFINISPEFLSIKKSTLERPFPSNALNAFIAIFLISSI